MRFTRFTNLGERFSTSMTLPSRTSISSNSIYMGTSADLAEPSQRHGSLPTENTSTLPPKVLDNPSPSTCSCATTSARSLEIPSLSLSKTPKPQMDLPHGSSPVCPLLFFTERLLIDQTTMSFDMLLDMVFPMLSRRAVYHSLHSAENTSSRAEPSLNVTSSKVFRGLELLL